MNCTDNRTMTNKTTQTFFPETLEQGLEVVLGSRVEQYLNQHPHTSVSEAMIAGKDSIKGRRNASNDRCSSCRQSVALKSDCCGTYGRADGAR